MDKMATIERRLVKIAPDDSADDALWVYTVQCHLVGFIAGAVVATVTCWILF